MPVAAKTATIHGEIAVAMFEDLSRLPAIAMFGNGSCSPLTAASSGVASGKS
eukprot:CAMPEP_0172928268 /NCGR_PEP_ID=MMETSP1075-20121228/217891_1 /TAXON_ID=2916 /ORGANISM="Ceratium fusus, Strain PA161109" /LENGTH=51 /DNA_ID=CAMNT_0013789551 /DNA_START=515 /DNA_END=667 /DNA_ORIENTATION=+